MFETGVVRANEINHSARSGGIIGIIFKIFFNMKVCCVFSLESPHRGDSNDYTQHTNINMIKKLTLNYSKYSNVFSYWNVSVNEPSVFESLKFYCNNMTSGSGLVDVFLESDWCLEKMLPCGVQPRDQIS